MRTHHTKLLPTTVQMMIVAMLVLVVVGLVYAPLIHAQSSSQPTTSISGLSYPSTAVIGDPIIVSFDVTYSVGSYDELWLFSAIGCLPEIICSSVVALGVSSTPPGCNPNYPFSNYPSVQPIMPESCYNTISSAGSESFSYRLSFSKVGTYNLTATVQLQLGAQFNVPTAWSVSQTMIITVCTTVCSTTQPQLTASTSVDLTPYTYSATSNTVTQTAPLQMPQPPQTTNSQPTINMPQIALVLVVIAAIVLYLLVRKHSKPSEHATKPLEL